jgi:hypothetical protein
MFLDQGERFDAILALADEMDIRKTFQKVRQFVARGLFVVDDECVDSHFWAIGYRESICERGTAFNLYT